MTSCRLAVRIFDVTVLSRELKAILTRLYFPRAILTVYKGRGEGGLDDEQFPSTCSAR